MNEEILSEFFSFVASDGHVISSKNLSDFEIFIQRQEFEDMREDLMRFLNDMIQFTVNRKEVKADANDEEMKSKKAISHIKKIYKDSKSSQANGKKATSYKKIYKKNIDFKRIKSNEVKNDNRHFLTNKSINLSISAEQFVLFFNINQPDHRETITKFVQILNKILQDKTKSTLQNFNRMRRSNRQYKIENETTHAEVEMMTSQEQKTDFQLDKSNDNETEKVNKISQTCVSDNEIVMRNKVNLFRVLKGVTANIIKSQREEGKEVPIIVEANALPEIETITAQKKESIGDGEDKMISHQEVEINANQPLQNIVMQEHEIDLKIVNGENSNSNTNLKQEQDKKVTNETQKQVTEDNTNKIPTSSEKEVKDINEQKKQKKRGKSNREGCSCKCLIF